MIVTYNKGAFQIQLHRVNADFLQLARRYCRRPLFIPSRTQWGGRGLGTLPLS